MRWNALIPNNLTPTLSKAHIQTAQDLGLIACHSCGRLNPISQLNCRCTRCEAPIHQRKPASLDRTWALMIAAIIMYVPANLLPMMRTESLVGVKSDTIMSGVIYFWHGHDYLVATIIFVASIFVPMLKLMILIYLLLAVRFQSISTNHWQPEQCAKLYRIIEFIGRWSMIDVFVVSLLTALIQMQSIATITAGPGAVAFGVVVVLTMLAALSFDPRIIWDNYYRDLRRNQHEQATTAHDENLEHNTLITPRPPMD
jgi:paraquat-inducible protein A